MIKTKIGYARIDLKNATIRLEDGHSNTAKVNDTNINDGDTSLDIDTLGTSEVIPESTRFTVVGSSETYEITRSNANAEFNVDVGTSTTGTFTLTFEGQTTASIQFDATAAEVQSALEALANVSVGDLTVTGSGTTGDPWVIKMLDDGAFEDIAVTLTGTDETLDGSLTVTTVHTGGVTHEIEFTPPLATSDGLPADDADITITGRTLKIKIGNGNFTYTENKEYNYERDRGKLDTVREGDEQPVDVNFDFVWEFLSTVAGVTTPSIEEVLKNTGPASTWESSSSDPCEPFAVNVEVQQAQPCPNVEDEFVTINDFRYETLEHNVQDAQVSATGRANVTQAVLLRR